MGWSGGTTVCVDIWEKVRKHVPAKKRPEVLAEIISVLTDQDWDCEYEIADEWPESRKALLIYNPNFFDYEDEDDE